MVEMENLATQTTEPTDLGTSYVNPASIGVDWRRRRRPSAARQ
ncbi:hypothetical protein HanPSC8_Chr05g0203911 [Helianthus annuus]|nr:hypothetical protein HanPSC8_Chr05g0203911 [Helianthus annuus]